MKKEEQILILLLKKAETREKKAKILQYYVAAYGQVSDEAGAQVREEMGGTKT